MIEDRDKEWFRDALKRAKESVAKREAMTKRRLRFVSKDPHLAEYYRYTFKDWFERELTQLEPHFAGTANIIEVMLPVWNFRMYAEAYLQEHYDYTTDKDGNRHQVLDEEGKPKLLIPEVQFNGQK